MADISKISPDNGTTIYDLKDIEARKRVPEVLLKDTVGWNGKNLAKSYFITNNTAKDSNALFIEGELEPNKEYILSFETSNIYNFYVNTNLTDSSAFINTVSGKNELRFTTKTTISKDNNTQYNTTYGWRILINGIAQSSAVALTNIMLRKADISDSTYEPYHESVEEVVEQVYADNGVLGAKNLIRYNRVTGNNGGKYELTTTGIRVYNEVATAWSQSIIHDLKLPLNKQIKLTGSVEYVSGDCNIVIQGSTDDSTFTNITSTGNKQSDFDLNVIFSTSTYTYYRLIILCNSSATAALGDVTVNDLMLRLASDTDDTYVPYAMTNREITDKIIKRHITSSDDLDDIKESGVYAIETMPINSPENQQYCTLVVNKITDTAINQIIYKADAGKGVMYIRNYGGSWRPWYKFTGTSIS